MISSNQRLRFLPPSGFAAFDFLEDVLLACAEDLESVGTQHYGGENIDTSQATNISSQRRRRTKDRSSLFVVQDSSGG
jgi:hypothetical protein